MAATRFLHNFDLIFCESGATNHKGADPRFDVPDDQVHAEGKHLVDFRIVTVDDLMAVTLFGCPDANGKATKIASIIEGQAKAVLIRGKIPLLVTLQAVEAGTGHIVRVALTYSERMAGAEGVKKHVYPDSAVPPNLTVGIGFNMDQPGAKAKFDALLGTGGTTTFDDVRNGTTDLTQSQMVTLLEDDQPTYEAAARRRYPGFDTMTPERQAALTEIHANLKNVGKFPAMNNAVNSGDFKTAAHELLHGAKGGPSGYLLDVKAGRANNVAAALRWRIVGSPASPEWNDVPPVPGDDGTRMA